MWKTDMCRRDGISVGDGDYDHLFNVARRSTMPVHVHAVLLAIQINEEKGRFQRCIEVRDATKLEMLQMLIEDSLSLLPA